MKTKKKVLMGIAAGLFAVVTVFNMGMLNENNAGDVSLDAVAVMAQAHPEGGTGTCGFNEWLRFCDGDGDGCNWNGTMCY